MVKKKVVDYVRAQLQKGYNISAIRDVMLKYGYSNKDIDDAVNEAYHPTIRHEIHLSHVTILVLIIISVSLIGTALFIFYPSKSPVKLLDLNLEPITTTVTPGESITFLKQLSNLGSSKRYDVVIKQELIDSKSFKTVTEKTETRAIETFGSTQTTMQVPQDTKIGDYILRVIIEYEDKKAIATLPVKVTSAKTGITTGTSSTKTQITDCNDNNPCTNDAIENNACVSKPIVPCCGNSICEENEDKNCAADCKQVSSSGTGSLEDIKELAKSNPDKALQQCSQIEVPDLKDECISNIGEVQRNKNYCSKIIDARTKDLCYSNIAKSANDNSLCQQISTEGIKDSCYMTFVLDNKDYSVCDKLINKALRQSCESLRQLHQLNEQQIQTQ